MRKSRIRSLLQRALAIDDILTRRAVRDHGDRVTDLLLDEIHIILRLLRKVLKTADAADVAFPAREYLVDRLASLEILCHRELRNLLSVELIRDADRNLIEISQIVEHGEGDIGRALDSAAVF